MAWSSADFKARLISRIREALPTEFRVASFLCQWASTQPNESNSLRIKVKQLDSDPPRYFIITIKEEQ